MQVILASASPRRLALLQQIGIEATVCPADFDEVSGSAVQAEDVVLANAVGKCQAVVKIKGDSLPVIAADTVVVAEGVILGKPQDAEDAFEMLKQLSGKTHKVLTGIAVSYAGEMLAEVCETKVVFRELTDEEIKNYVATGEPLDKAGAYGIQGKGAVLVEKIDGCYNNVVGLPLTRMQLILAKLGVR
ncbi:MAG: septum formation inhibitor Maf [Phascolarctobacterium sp.]|jgi:septum formation protein|nr:septum formation inhibitor Maf [Phascolarctobacterium sp.]